MSGKMEDGNPARSGFAFRWARAIATEVKFFDARNLEPYL
jgi:hypothetical protein